MGSVISLAMAVLLAATMWLASPGPAAASPAFSAIAVDASTGDILYQRNCDGLRYPASLTKVMTLYLLFEDLRSGKVSLSTRLTVSPHAAAQQPSKLGLKPGSTISVSDAIGALVTKSANDIAVAVAEGLEGSEFDLCRAHDPHRPRHRHDPHHLPQRLRPARQPPEDDGARHGHPGLAHPARFP